MKEIKRLLKEDDTKFIDVTNLKHKFCKDCRLQDECRKNLKEGCKIIHLPKQENCITV